MKEFITAARAAAEPQEAPLEFTLTRKDENGEVIESQVCHAYKPNEGQVAVLMATTSARHLSEPEMVAGIINFFVEILDEETHHYIVNRLLRKDDDFGIGEVQEIINWMMEEWSGRPTQLSPASTPSQASGGATSTPPTPPSTSSGSPFIASATSSGSGAPIV